MNFTVSIKRQENLERTTSIYVSNKNGIERACALLRREFNPRGNSYHDLIVTVQLNDKRYVRGKVTNVLDIRVFKNLFNNCFFSSSLLHQ